MTRDLRRTFELNLAKNLKSNPKAFWKYAKSKLKTTSKIGDLTRDDGSLLHNPKEKADLLNETFSEVFTDENAENVPSIMYQYDSSPLESVSISPDMILKKLRKLDPFKTPGPDGYHPRNLKDCAEPLCRPLLILFNKSIDDKSLPSQWKVGHSTPLHKKGNKHDPRNYIDLSVLPQLCANY